MVFFCGWCLPRLRRRRSGRRGGDRVLNNDHDQTQTQTQPPRYREVERSSCVLLQTCWNQDWPAVVRRLDTHPRECFFITSNNRRTALHLCTMPGAHCPMYILEALLDINPHAVLMHDSHQHGGTPLHFLCGSNHRYNPEIVQLFVETALQMEQMYYNQDGGNYLPFNAFNGFSPLYMACRKAAPAETLEILVNARRRTRFASNSLPSTSDALTSFANNDEVGRWIAPWTGGELTDDPASECLHRLSFSPLLELWITLGVYLEERNYNLDPLMLQRLRDITIQILQSSSSSATQLTSFSWSEPIQPLEGTSHNDNNSSSSSNEGATLQSWVKCLVLLRPSIPSYSVFLHTLACSRCPIPALFRFACQLFPEQLLWAADRVAVNHDESSSPSSTTSLLFGRPRIPLHLLLSRQWQSNTRVLEDMVKISLETNPECGQVRDPVTGLYPFCLAASQDAPLTVIYTLLQTFPLVVVDRKRTTPTAMANNSNANRTVTNHAIV